MHPVSIIVWLGVLLASTCITYKTATARMFLSPLRLLTGYAGAVLACAILAAYSAYISPSEASAVWHVPTERYREVLQREFISSLFLSVMTATTGIALVGMPVMLRLARAGHAQLGWIMMASVAISLAWSLLFSLVFLSSATFWLKTTLQLIGLSIPAHLFICGCFCLGAGVPWKTRAPA
ncbi:hypothetical protein ACQ4WQ_05180 [Janthinobacterium sp. GB1R12]|uniref:hypothetical protein n=1 Tax=Janthinobacterium sp. GB1R12 TaxID=3424190 RepID=UPI003F21AECB